MRVFSPRATRGSSSEFAAGASQLAGLGKVFSQNRGCPRNTGLFTDT